MNINDFIEEYGMNKMNIHKIYKLENDLSIEFVNECIKQVELENKFDDPNPINMLWFKSRKESK